MKRNLISLCWACVVVAAGMAGGCAPPEAPPEPRPKASAPKPPAAAQDEVWTSEQLVFLQEKFGAMETTPSGLRYKIVQPGTGEARPSRANLVSVHYRGTFLDGRVFDDSRAKGRPFQFRVGVGHVIKGWDQAVIEMRRGEKRVVVVPYWLGYGVAGKIPYILPRTTLVFDIELIDWESTAKVPGAQTP